MKADETRCKNLCRAIVMLKKRCEAGCGKTWDTEEHHGIFKSDQRYKLNPVVWYDPELQFELCDMCHRHNSSAPHVNNKAFLKFMAKKDPDKVARIIELTSGPIVNIDVREMDWKEVYEELEEKFNQFTGV